jgi:hypothetical protein
VRRKPLQDIPCCVDGIAGAGSAAGAGGKNMMQCRGCRYCQCVRIYMYVYVWLMGDCWIDVLLYLCIALYLQFFPFY